MWWAAVAWLRRGRGLGFPRAQGEILWHSRTVRLEDLPCVSWRTCLLIGCAVVAIMIVVVGQPVLARTQLHCSTTLVVIVGVSTGKTSSRTEENLSFVIDD